MVFVAFPEKRMFRFLEFGTSYLEKLLQYEDAYCSICWPGFNIFVFLIRCLPDKLLIDYVDL